MSEEENKLAERRLKELVWDRHDPEAADEFVHPDVVEHNSILGPRRGRDGYKSGLRMAFHAFPDATLEQDDLIAEGDRVVERWTIRGTQRAEFMGIPATNNRSSSRVSTSTATSMENGPRPGASSTAST